MARGRRRRRSSRQEPRVGGILLVRAAGPRRCRRRSRRRRSTAHRSDFKARGYNQDLRLNPISRVDQPQVMLRASRASNYPDVGLAINQGRPSTSLTGWRHKGEDRHHLERGLQDGGRCFGPCSTIDESEGRDGARGQARPLRLDPPFGTKHFMYDVGRNLLFAASGPSPLPGERPVPAKYVSAVGLFDGSAPGADESFGERLRLPASSRATRRLSAAP